MRIYYSIKFKGDKKPEVIYFDAIAFTVADGNRYSIDVTGDHDFTVEFENGICTVEGRVKGDCDSIVDLNDEDADYEDIKYDALHKLLLQAETEDLEFVLVTDEDEEILDYVSYEVNIELNDCEPLSFKQN